MIWKRLRTEGKMRVNRLLKKAEIDEDLQDAVNTTIAVTADDNIGRSPVIEALEIKKVI